MLSLRGWVLILDGFNHQVKRTLLNIYTHAQSPWRSRLPGARQLLVYTAASAYLLILLEWIFHVTKVSFMDSLSLGQKLSVLLLSGLFLAAAGMLVNLVLLLLEFILRYLRLAWLAACLNTVIPAASVYQPGGFMGRYLYLYHLPLWHPHLRWLLACGVWRIGHIVLPGFLPLAAPLSRGSAAPRSPTLPGSNGCVTPCGVYWLFPPS